MLLVTVPHEVAKNGADSSGGRLADQLAAREIAGSCQLTVSGWLAAGERVSKWITHGQQIVRTRRADG
jgi:hypothetical protein